MSSVRHYIFVDFSQIADATLSLHTPSFLWELIRRILRSRKGQKEHGSSSSAPHAMMVPLMPGAMLGAQLPPFTPCGFFTAWLHWRSLWLRVKNGLLSIISHSPCHQKIRTINLWQPRNTPMHSTSPARGWCQTKPIAWVHNLVEKKPESFPQARLTHNTCWRGNEKYRPNAAAHTHRDMIFMTLFSTQTVMMDHRKIPDVCCS